MKKLYKEIELELKNKFGNKTRVWVWPSYNEVMGFYGNGLLGDKIVVWITERPSLARDITKQHKFPDWIDKIFYRVLKEEGFGNIHLTDFVKIMDKAGEVPTKEELDFSAELMKKELDKLKQPDKKLIIVANSKNVAIWMEEYLPEYPFVYIEFFKRIVRYNKREERESKLKKILRSIKRE